MWTEEVIWGRMATVFISAIVAAIGLWLLFIWGVPNLWELVKPFILR